MNTSACSPLSNALPELFRRRAGPFLRVLLEAVDAEWLASAHSRPNRSWATPGDLTGLDTLGRATGWGHLLDEVGGIGRVAKPAMLTRLLDPDPSCLEKECIFWVDCLFGLSLKSVSVRRGPLASVPPRARVEVAGTPRASDFDSVFRVLARLLPAHLVFTHNDLIIVPLESTPVPPG